LSRQLLALGWKHDGLAALEESIACSSAQPERTLYQYPTATMTLTREYAHLCKVNRRKPDPTTMARLERLTALRESGGYDPTPGHAGRKVRGGQSRFGRLALRLAIIVALCGVFYIVSPHFLSAAAPRHLVPVGQLTGVTCTSPSNCTATGSGASTLVEHWNGSAWSIVKSQAPPNTVVWNLDSVVCPSSSSC
jgi:hypothetical protein